ncbi:NAD-dependent epimerase/dehydratase family protein [Saccharopolyspora phatthalungensis]|uniref:Nucleoside-diphosphate-sugar epimerase n=1 Tax=Saccharopolyspora phatthalungensis TaxID=664693 RepID=A0A840QB67_9PSEU|nr:NAD(P)-dependent oxidoreductase [Saccharopolyspora phatthalungensis]MBB5158004.1 nucleoside-diphosphate-sugar epimerase [Saccharopolyspora phatthalungensis]
MTILVTGATGRVGSRFVPRLLRQGRPVRVLARDAGRAEGLAKLGAEVAIGDLTDRSDLDTALNGAKAVVHLGAAFRGVSDEEAVATNHTATVELAKAALQAGVERFVYASTSLVYGAGPGRPARESDEMSPPQGFGAYPISKADGEKALLDLHRTDGLPLRVARLAFVYGDGDPHLSESLIWATEWPLHKRFHLVHHADVSQALIRLTWAAGVDGEVFNVADDSAVTALELLDINGQPASPDAADRPLDNPWGDVLDSGKIRRELGFRPIYPTVYTARDAGAL